jgi:hypothetical protein
MERKTVKIDEVEYYVDSMSEEVIASLENINIATNEIARLEMEYRLAVVAKDFSIKHIAEEKSNFEAV